LVPRSAPCVFFCAKATRPFLLGQRGVDVQHERVGIGAERCHDERRPLRHQPEMNATSRDRRSSLATQIAAFALRATASASRKQRSALESVAALAGFGFDLLAR
jgi:hypothetical protein